MAARIRCIEAGGDDGTPPDGAASDGAFACGLDSVFCTTFPGPALTEWTRPLQYGGQLALVTTPTRRLPAEIDALTRDPSEDVRASAVQALRNCPPDVANGTLERMLLDPSARVRAAVVDAFAQQNPSDLVAELLAGRLGVDGSSGVRGAIVRFLQTYYGRSVIAKTAVDRAAESDPDPEVRALAKSTRVMFATR